MLQSILPCFNFSSVRKVLIMPYLEGCVQRHAIILSQWGLFGGFGPPFLYFRLLEVFAQNWVPFWSPFLEFSGPLDILEQCNGRDFNNECFQSIVIVKNGRGEFCPALRVWWYYCIDFKIVAQLKFTFLVLAHLGYPIFNREALM